MLEPNQIIVNSMSEKFEDVNRTTYSTPEAVEIYSRDYVWPYEKFLFETYIKFEDRILDLGCGTGRSTKYLAEKSKYVIGIDMSSLFIDRGKSLHPELDLRVMNAADLLFPDNYFDFVFFSNQGIDYSDQHGKIIKEANRVLKAGGIFAYSSHNSLFVPRTWKTLQEFIKNISNWTSSYHVRVEHHENGDLYVAHNNIWAEGKMIRQAGFQLIEVLTNSYSHPRLPQIIVGLFARWPMYVCQK